MKIQIKCPVCGAVLAVEDSQKNTGKKVKCPVCRNVSLYEDFRKVNAASNAAGGGTSTYVVTNQSHSSMGLVDLETGTVYKLRNGFNKIGRMTYLNPPRASVPISRGEGKEDMGFSREHCIIELRPMNDGLTHAFISNDKNKNQTFINDSELMTGDIVELNDGDIIKSSSTELRFVLQKED